MRRKGRPKKQKSGKNTGRRPGRPRKRVDPYDEDSPRPGVSKQPKRDPDEATLPKKEKAVMSTTVLVVDDGMSEGLHMTTSQVHALGALVACRECGEAVRIGVRPTTKGMISEFTVACIVCEDTKSTNTPNLVRERKRKREKKDAVLQKTENINYAHVAAFLDNGLGYSGLRHYCKYFNARCLNEATFIVYARQVISDVVADTEESLQYSASIVREVFKSQLETDGLVDLTVAFTTTYHQWGSDFCLVAGAVIELTTGLVMDYDVANMYCHVCKINAKKIVSMSPAEMTEWFNKHQDTCEIREWCDELDHDAEEGVREIEPKYLECFIAKKIWSRSIDKFGFRYTTLIHESDEKIHEELSRAGVYGDVPILIDSATSCFSRRKSEHARTSFQTKLKAKCPRERVQTKDRIMYVYSMSIPEYNKFAISSNIKLRQLVKEMEGGVEDTSGMMGGEGEERMPNALQMHEVKAIKRLVANGEEEEEEEEEEERAEREIMLEEEEVNREEQEVDDPEELEEEEEEGMEQGEDEEELLEEEEALAAQNAEEEERRKLEAEWGEEDEEEDLQQLAEEEEGDVGKQIEEMLPLHIKEESRSHIKEEVLGLDHQLEEEDDEEEEDEEEDEEQHQLEEIEEQPQQEDEEEELEQLDDEDEEELEQLRLDDDDEQMEENEEEEELQVQEQMQENVKLMLEEEEKEAAPQPTAKLTTKQAQDKTRTEDKSKSAPANQGTKQGELRLFRKEEKKSQEEESSRKRKQDDEEEEQGAATKKSKQNDGKAVKEDSKQTKEQSKQEEHKQKESERGVRDKKDKQPEGKEESTKEQDKRKVDCKQGQKEDQPKEKEEKKKMDSQQVTKKEEKQNVDMKRSEKEEKQKTDSKPSENKETRHQQDSKPSDKTDDRHRTDNKPSEKKEEKSVTEKKNTEAKPQEKEAKERERDTTKQREEESKPRAGVKQKGDASQLEKAEAGRQPAKKAGESEVKAAGGEASGAADTRPKVTANATVTEKA